MRKHTVLFLALATLASGAILASGTLMGCASLQGHKAASLPSADFLAVQELRDTTYFQSRASGGPFSGRYYTDRDSSFATVAIDSVYLRALDVRGFEALDSTGRFSPSFFRAAKAEIISTYQILGGHRQ